jgi:hypothetical protein
VGETGPFALAGGGWTRAQTRYVLTTSEPGAATGGLLERSRELSALGTWLDDAKATAHGHFVFVGGETASLVAAGAKPHPIAAALLRELARQTPTLLVIEDAHWADEATLDVLRLLARRIGTVPALVLISYRDDEVDRRAPLRIVLGELATARDVGRMFLAPLSLEAVAKLATPHGLDAKALYRATGGNPFFVTEVLAGRHEHIPATVRDAVLARTARLGTRARPARRRGRPAAAGRRRDPERPRTVRRRRARGMPECRHAHPNRGGRGVPSRGRARTSTDWPPHTPH